MLSAWKAICSMSHVVCSALFWVFGLMLLSSIANKEKDNLLLLLVIVCAVVVIATSKNADEGVFHLIAFPFHLLSLVRY